MGKIHSYYKKYGFFELIKKIHLRIHKIVIVWFYNTFQKYKKKNIKILKQNKIAIFSNEKSKNRIRQLECVSETLNDMGYEIDYIYCNKRKAQTKNLKVSKVMSIKKFCKEKQNEIYIYDEAITKQRLNHTSSKNEIVLNLNSISNYKSYCESLPYIEKQCNKKFYNNISIIVLNYNNKNVIFQCIDTLKQYQKKYGYEIIIVDNQSTDGSYELLKKDNDIKLYQNNKNGCSSGRNLGVKYATKEYIMFLDSDQWILHANWLDPYLQIFEICPLVGAIGWAAGWFKKDGFTYLTTDDFSFRYMPPSGLARSDIGYLGSGGMMVSKKIFEEVGGFDEYYDPTCYEDTDFSLKIRNCQKEILYCPYLGIGHKPHQTTKNGSDAHTELIREKGAYFVNKWKNQNPNLLKYIK